MCTLSPSEPKECGAATKVPHLPTRTPMKLPQLSGKQLAVGAALSTLVAQAVAYGKELPQGMEWVVVIASVLLALWTGSSRPKGQ